MYVGGCKACTGLSPGLFKPAKLIKQIVIAGVRGGGGVGGGGGEGVNTPHHSGQVFSLSLRMLANGPTKMINFDWLLQKIW